jgi:hypothetical protein
VIRRESILNVAKLADDLRHTPKLLTLVTALRKLGFEMMLPDRLRADEHQAA